MIKTKRRVVSCTFGSAPFEGISVLIGRLSSSHFTIYIKVDFERCTLYFA